MHYIYSMDLIESGLMGVLVEGSSRIGCIMEDFL